MRSVQRVPDLLISLKAAVDRDTRPGRFVITGSSQLSANTRVAETLAGRVERLVLWPFSQGEIAGRKERFIDRVLANDVPVAYESSLDKRGYLERAAAGGFPEAILRSGKRRAAWFDSYVETVVEREAPSVSASPRTADLPKLMRLVAARHASLLNTADLAADAQLPRTSVHRYLDVLEAVFLVIRLPAWSANLSQREIRAPKIYVTDAGLATRLRRAEVSALAVPEVARGAEGPIVEGFVATELLRQSGWSEGSVRLSHYRDRTTEVDLVLEGEHRVAAIEVKAGVGADDKAIRNLGRFRDRLGERFACGVVLHSGRQGSQLTDRIYSLPISALWEI